MSLGADTDIEITAVAFVEGKPLFLAKGNIVFDGFVKSCCQFGNAFTFKIHHAVNAFNLPEEDTVFLGEIHCSDITFIT